MLFLSATFREVGPTWNFNSHWLSLPRSHYKNILALWHVSYKVQYRLSRLVAQLAWFALSLRKLKPYLRQDSLSRYPYNFSYINMWFFYCIYFILFFKRKFCLVYVLYCNKSMYGFFCSFVNQTELTATLSFFVSKFTSCNLVMPILFVLLNEI